MADMPTMKTRIESVMEDPASGAIARVYAQSLLDALPADQAAEAVEEFQSFVDEVLAKNEEFETLLTSARIGRDDKLKLIERVVAGRGSELFTNFLRVLARHERLDLLPAILGHCRVQYELRTGRKRVQVASATPLSAEVLTQIETRLAAAFAFQPVLEPAVDPSLLGGLRIRVGDTVYDGSLRARLNQLRLRVRDRSLHEIQSGRDRFSHSERD
ncbi:MAG: ATP synthase F1 subunit delta [Planctomycetaceae bacterium]|nr:ATP synthase F1 subunit delta [Planctomycetaceae bacterium]